MPSGRRPRAGSLVPLTLLLLSVSVVCSFATVDLALHAMRRSRALVWSDRLTRSADEALRSVWVGWGLAPPWSAPVGTPGEARVVTGAGDTVLVTWRRTHPLIVWVHARARTFSGGIAIERSVQRVAWLQAPVPSASWPASSGAVSSWPAALEILDRQFPATAWDAAAGSDSAWRFLHLAETPAQSPRLLRARGWVVVDGPTHLADGSRIEGILVVRGVLEVSGTLTIDGELVLLHGPKPAGVLVRPNGYAVEMAMATAARPRLGPFHIWHEGP